MAQCGGGDSEFLGGASEVEVFGHGAEGGELQGGEDEFHGITSPEMIRTVK
jgi:hypothetical protein